MAWSFTRKRGRDRNLVNSNLDCDNIRKNKKLRDSFFLGCYLAIHSPAIFDRCRHYHGSSENSMRRTKTKTVVQSLSLCFPADLFETPVVFVAIRSYGSIPKVTCQFLARYRVRDRCWPRYGLRRRINQSSSNIATWIRHDASGSDLKLFLK